MVLRYNKGFTLIEIMIVIAILSILAAIAVTQFALYRRNANDASAMADLKSAATAQEAYYIDNKSYAGSITSLALSNAHVPSPGVTLTVAGSQHSYTILSYHSSGNKTFTLIGPGGKIEGD